ncbi:MAG TPA: metallophosphoesterase [Flavobacteriaceae bacterium]|nr:metallophosphoesterase [Flavobacteriaceae bacterium]
MNKYNKVLTFLGCFLLISCASFEPKYADGQPQADFGYPEGKDIETTIYLVGDAGYSDPPNISKGLLTLKNTLDTTSSKNDMVIFLGDNIYPDGMPPKESPQRTRSEYRVDAQLNSLTGFKGNILFITGNHEWYNEGIPGIEREAAYIEKRLGKEDVWAPKPGCGFEIQEISDNVVLFILDTQWFLEDWNDHPEVNKDCPEMRSREAVLEEIESELEDYPNKTIVFAMHHPLYSNGVHGGQFPLNRHLYPTQRLIPLPILGSLATLIRTAGGVSIQDLQNKRYKSMVGRLTTIAQNAERLVFVSGHEHSLQYIKHENITQIVSGSGSKATFVSLSNDGLFASPQQGFAKLDIFKDGSSWVSYYTNDNNKPETVYQTEVFPPPKEYPVDSLPDKFPKTVLESVYETNENLNSDFYNSLFGKRYGNLYTTKIEVPIADLDTLYGGMEILSAGGGHQTKSLAAKDSEDHEYRLRQIAKSALLLIQNTAFQEEPVEKKFKNTIIEDALNDFFTSSHPFAFMTIPTLSEAAGIYHTYPELYYLPKQDNLKTFNYEFGNELFMIEKHPGESYLDTKLWGNPNEDIENTAGVYARLRRDEKYSVDEKTYIRARIFDMLIGDFDRHEGQFSWAEHKKENGEHYFVPIPEDRDQAFADFDGPFFGTLRALVGFAKQFARYGPTVHNVKWLNAAGLSMDRTLIEHLGKETWIEQAKYLQEHLSDSIIEKAFSALPVEFQNESTKKLAEDVKARRNNLVKITERYYRYMAKLQIITATDKDDHFEIERLPEGKTRIKVSRIKDGKTTEPFIDRTFYSEITHEIWVYGLDDDDVFEVHGNGDADIHIKLIGGLNNDVYRITSGKNLAIYDYKSKPNTFEKIGNANLHITDNYEYNHFDKDKKIFSTNLILPAFGYNPDDGFKIGVTDVYTVNGFKRNPFSQQHKLRAGYYFATSGFDLEYEAQFANVVGYFNLLVGAYFTSPNFTRNFFGYGNETPNLEDELSKDYNRIRISRMGVDIGLIREGPFGSNFRYKAILHSVQLEATANRFLVDNVVPSSTTTEFYDRKYFAGAEAAYWYDSYDHILNPTRGMKFEVSGGIKTNVEETENTFGFINSYVEFYNALTRNRKWVLKTNARTRFNISDGYEFYQAAQLGGGTGLRGYRNERFTGKTAFAAGADIRYSFDEFNTRFLPFQIGVYVGGDVGRVWGERFDSDRWHNDYGGGFWINSANAINGTFGLFNGEDGLRFSFGFGFSF